MIRAGCSAGEETADTSTLRAGLLHWRDSCRQRCRRPGRRDVGGLAPERGRHDRRCRGLPGGCCPVTIEQSAGGAQEARSRSKPVTSVRTVDEELAEVAGLEMLLLQPQVRNDPERLLSLLHPDFSEYGSSGRVWSGVHRSGDERDTRPHRSHGCPGQTTWTRRHRRDLPEQRRRSPRPPQLDLGARHRIGGSCCSTRAR